MAPFSEKGSLDEIRMKYDFEYYVEQKLIIPNQPDSQKYIITKNHKRAIQSIQDHDFSVLEGYR